MKPTADSPCRTLGKASRRDPRRPAALRVENLEARDVPATFAFDFDTNTTAAAAGYTHVPLTTYSATLGYGWQSVTGMQAVNRSAGTPLTRDLHLGTDNTFFVRVPNGQYDLTATVGDATTVRDRVSVFAEGQSLTSNLRTARGQFLEVRGRVTVSDGQLAVRFADGGGSNSKFAVAGLRVTTVDPTATSLWGTAPPATSTDSDPNAIEVGVKFQPLADGFVTGVRYFKQPETTGTHVGNLWTAGGQRLATATFTNETASGWQQVTFATPVAVKANTTYVVSYFAPNGRYAANTDYFTASGYWSGPLMALSNGQGGNGVYRYGATSGFPTSTWNASNYWVDVSFRLGAGTPAPTASAGPDRTGAEGSAVAFAGSATGAGLTYRWDFGDGTSATGTLTPTHVYADDGTYVATLTVTDSTGRTATDTAAVTVANVAPTAGVGDDNPVAEGSPVYLFFEDVVDPSSADTAAGFRFSYDFDDDGAWDVTDSASPSAQHTFDDDGTHSVRMRVKDKDGGFTDSVNQVDVAGAAPAADFGNDGPVTPGSPATVAFTNPSDPSAADTAAGFRYSFDFDGDGAWDVVDSLSPSAEYTFAAAGTYAVRGRIADKDGAFADYTTAVTVAAPSSPPTADAGPDQSGTEGSVVAFAGSATGTGLTYRWDFGDGTSADGTLTPTHAYADDGTYVATLTVTDAAGRAASDITTVVVGNVAPTASVTGPSSVPAGVAARFSLAGPSDPSAADTAAGFRYSFDFDGDGTFEVEGSTEAWAEHAFGVAGTYTVLGRIADKDGGFSDSTATVAVTAAAPAEDAPAAPSGLAATPVSQSEINLTWNLGDARDTAVVIERKTGAGGTWGTLVVLPGGEHIYTDTSGWAGRTYVYRVKARNAAGDSGSSPEKAATTRPVAGGALRVVSGLRAVAASPTTATVTFTDTNTGTSSRMYLLERSDNGITYRVVASLGTGTSFRDVGLTPGATYSYRVRAASRSAATSDYSAPAALTLPALAATAAVAPSGLHAENLSATTVRLTWTNNDPSNPQFRVERAAYSSWHEMTWSQVALTAPGATSFTDTGLTAESPYVYRVRATNAAGNSDYATPASDVMKALLGDRVAVATASTGTGSPKVYDIGPGRPYATIAALDWSRLGPGDTVNIHYKPGGYKELFQVAVRGTPAAWITITGVPDPATGALPVIDGANAVLHPQFANHYAPLHGFGAIVVGTRPGWKDGYQPGYVTIQNLEIKNAYSANRFTDTNGIVKNYGNVGAGIYLERADHVTIKGNVIRDNGEGIFGAGQSYFARLMTDLTIDSNHIYGNGNPNSYLEHNTYLEGIDTVYQFNRYGPTRSGSAGAGLKDRSVGTVIRYNFVEGGAGQLQLPEAQNQIDLAMALPRYHTMAVYGNTLVTPPGNASPPIWFGGDQGLDPFNRKGVLYLFNNTMVVRSTQAQVYKINLVRLASAGESLDARNNVFAAVPATAGAGTPDLGLVAADNNAYYGPNWVTAGYYPTTTGSYAFTGHLAGTENFITGPPPGPGFVSPAAGDYRLTAGSAAVDTGGRLAGSMTLQAPVWQYLPPGAGTRRTVVGAATDLGAFEHGV